MTHHTGLVNGESMCAVVSKIKAVIYAASTLKDRKVTRKFILTNVLAKLEKLEETLFVNSVLESLRETSFQ